MLRWIRSSVGGRGADAAGYFPFTREALVACLHWRDAPSRGEEMADAVETLMRVGLPYCKHPAVATATTHQPWTEDLWRNLKSRLAAKRLRRFEFADPSAGTFTLGWEGHAREPVGVIHVHWPRIRRHTEPDEPSFIYKPYFSARDSMLVQHQMVEALGSIFTRLGCCYGFIHLEDAYRGLRDSPTYTRVENEQGIPGMLLPEALAQVERVTNWVRGAFWGNWLGPGQIEALGGKQRVLKEAPAAVKLDLGPPGVYLQATKSVWKLQRRHMEQLEEFMRPALPTREALGYPPLPRRTPEELAALAGAPDPPPLPRRRVGRYEPSFPVTQSRQRGGGNVVFALHVVPDPTQELARAVAQLLRPWWEEGAQGAFGGTGFQFLSDIGIEGDAIIWFVDWGDARTDGYYDLLRRLDEFCTERHVTVTRLQVGLEEMA